MCSATTLKPKEHDMDIQQDQASTSYRTIADRHFEDTKMRLKAVAGDAVAANKHDFKGELVIIISLIGYVHVVMTATFPDGVKLRFEGNGGGLIAGGGGASYGGGSSTLLPDRLLAAGPMPFALQATPAGVVLEFAGPGVFAGGGPNIAAGHAAGSGRWTKA